MQHQCIWFEEMKLVFFPHLIWMSLDIKGTNRIEAWSQKFSRNWCFPLSHSIKIAAFVQQINWERNENLDVQVTTSLFYEEKNWFAQSEPVIRVNSFKDIDKSFHSRVWLRSFFRFASGLKRQTQPCARNGVSIFYASGECSTWRRSWRLECWLTLYIETWLISVDWKAVQHVIAWISDL